MKEIFPSEIIKTSVEHHFASFSKKSNILYYFVVVLFVGSACSIFLIKTEITVQSRGILRSSTQSVSISSPIIAEVTKCKLSENMLVNKGDTLLWLNDKKVNRSIDHYQNLIFENNLYLSDISKILDFRYSELETELFMSQHAEYRQKLEEFDLIIQAQKIKYDRSKKLYENQVIAPIEFEECEFNYSRAIEHKLNYVRTSRKEWERLAVGYRSENKKYNREIALFENERKNYYIISPETGYITNYDGVITGSFITTGQVIGTISPDNYLLAEHLVAPKDIGYLHERMDVLFQIDAYNYNQWGMATGKIIDISNEIHLINNTPWFKVKCCINEEELSLKNGYKGRLRKGMTATARFKITKRTIAQLLFDKTDNWLNPNIITD